MTKIYIPPRLVDAAVHYMPCFKRLGVTVITEYSGSAAGVMVFADRDCKHVAGHLRYMSKESLDILLNRDWMYKAGVPTIPTTYIKDGAATKEGMFIKPRNSAYFRGESGWVEQPHLGFPIEDIDITIAVNKDSEVMAYDEHHMTHLAYNRPADTRPIEPEALATATEHIQTVCKNLKITGGIHNVQFLKYEGQWCLSDWNPRPGESHTIGLASMNAFSDRPLAFMLGIDLPEPVPHAIGTKAYWDNPIPFASQSLMRQFSLFGRTASKVNGYGRLTGVAESREKLEENFREFELLARKL